jgi:predicted metal-dependent hydrolase
MEYSIKTDGGTIAYTLVRRKMKHIRISVTGERRVVVSAPHRCAEGVVRAFVQDNITFIHRQLSEIEARRSRHYPVSYIDGDQFSYLGQTVRLHLVPAVRASSVFDGSILTLDVPPGGCAKSQFIRWMGAQARIVFAQRLSAVSAKFPDSEGLTLSVKRMLTRWGSINTARRRVSLTVHLMRCETELIDYVITHELCHLNCRSHSPAFYRELQAWYPDRRVMDKQLEAYGIVDF